jgi:sulfate permease, SulP family
VVIGFTNAIAVLIASTQIKDFFGLHLEKVPGVFWLRVEALAGNFHTLSFEATALAGFTLLTLIICRGLSARVPGPIVALLLSTCAVYFFKLPVETIGTRFGGIPAGLPHWQIPHFRTDLIHGLLGPAFTVAMLGAIESLMSAVVSDRMSTTGTIRTLNSSDRVWPTFSRRCLADYRLRELLRGQQPIFARVPSRPWPE